MWRPGVGLVDSEVPAMKNLFGLARLILIARRIAVALERANELELHRQRREFPPLKSDDAPPKLAEISRPTVDSWNERHEQRGRG